MLSRGRGAGAFLNYVFAPPREGSQRCARRLDRLAVVIGEAMGAYRPAARTVGGLQFPLCARNGIYLSFLLTTIYIYGIGRGRAGGEGG